MNNQKSELKKQVSTFEATSMVVGVVIGSGIFFKASAVFADAGTPLLGVLTWLVAGLITMAAALTFAEISVAFPKTGGPFVYIKELYGEKWAFAYGWIQAFVQVPAVCAALFLMTSTALTAFFALSDFQIKLIAFAIMLFVTAMQIYSTNLGSKTQMIVTVAKMVPIIFIILFGIFSGDISPAYNVVPKGASEVSFSGFGAAILGVLWAYEGWQGVGNMAGELKNPAKSLPRSIFWGILTIIISYVLINLAMIYVLPVDQIIASKMPATEVAVKLFGDFGADLISAGILISVFGAANGYFLVGSRFPYAMAQENLFIFPNFFKKVNKRFNTPINAIVLQLIICTIYIFAGTLQNITNMVVFVVWLFSVLIVAGIFILRKKFSHIERSYKVPFYPVVPIIGMIGGSYIIFSSLFNDTKNAMYGIFMTLISFPIYYWIKSK
jgi:APA family basic amino acid/polyamine antiporter